MRPIGLRARVSAAFALGALILSACISLVSYESVRNTLFAERERTAVRATYYDATVVSAGIGGPAPDVLEVLQSLDTGTDRYVLLHLDGRWHSRSADLAVDTAVPPGLQEMTASGEAGAQRIRRDGRPALIVGVPLAGAAVFYEIVSLGELERTLQTLALVLTAVAIMVAAAGAAVGWYVTRHALRPVTAVAEAARGIAGGDLTTRLDPATEPDLAPLSAAFNDMADQLSRRLERDRRFAADVSHELRSPLQTLEAAASVLDKRRDQLDERAGAAVGLVTAEISRFQALVNDLLELARTDQPAHREPVDVPALARRICHSRDLPGDLVETVPGTPATWSVDKRRVEQALGNLIDNAVRYGGGPIAVRVGPGYLEVDDAGPGVSENDRPTIFDRFVRGRAANARGDGDGTGLGLAIVAGHAAAHGGDADVTERPGGGARFRMTFPGFDA
ncbi:two-component sensor histidine kinase [Actinoplanes philippinensis]|uniref:histidine kinase n=1 Tax=Actinoplanes philippinensis TaxID=35752 RepID=A0A1I2I0B2_9ACTN|nr:HAMP domain-containing sensor histidine kinase [Actinoplanes philippinensis]GIE78762.1 two-component sensor histidine kinase [Actinoplanes philippinensis]SFF35769.1 Signal transduction histidine kinase [Actinoplanes philippinensis]